VNERSGHRLAFPGPCWCAKLRNVIRLAEFAEELGVDPGDVRVLLVQLGEYAEDISDGLGAEIRDQLDQFGERTVPALWWPGSDPYAGSGATKMR
jgi:hypothetical protein